MPRPRFTLRWLMVAVAVFAALFFLDPYITGGSRGHGRFDVEVHIQSLSGRQAIDLAWERGRLSADVPYLEFEHRARWIDGTPVIPVQFGIAHYGCARRIEEYSQERYFVLRIDFDDGSCEYVGVEVPDRFRPRPLNSLVVLVE